MTLLPNYEQAFIAVEKLSDYCLNCFHPVGKEKASVFKSALNLTEQDADFLKNAILKGLTENNAISGIQDQYGKRFTVDIKIRNLDLEAIIRTAWIIITDENFPRLITCYVK